MSMLGCATVIGFAVLRSPLIPHAWKLRQDLPHRHIHAEPVGNGHGNAWKGYGEVETVEGVQAGGELHLQCGNQVCLWTHTMQDVSVLAQRIVINLGVQFRKETKEPVWISFGDVRLEVE